MAAISKQQPVVSVVIVAFNSRQHLIPALGALHKAHDSGLIQCILVDNASDDGTADFVEETYPWVDLVRSGDNLGFGRGCNLAFERVTAPYVLLHNPDAEIEADAIQSLVAFMDSHPAVGIASPAIIHAQGRLQPVGKMITHMIVIRGALGFSNSDPSVREVKPGTPAFRTNWVCGAMMLIRSDLYRRLGGFDPRFFLYFEETDLCRRAAAQGAEIWSVGESVARHEGAASAKSSGELLASNCIAEHYFRSRFYFLGKHFGWTRAVFAESLDCVLAFARWGRNRLVGRTKRPNPFAERPFFQLPALPRQGDAAQALTATKD